MLATLWQIAYLKATFPPSIKSRPGASLSVWLMNSVARTLKKLDIIQDKAAPLTGIAFITSVSCSHQWGVQRLPWVQNSMQLLTHTTPTLTSQTHDLYHHEETRVAGTWEYHHLQVPLQTAHHPDLETCNWSFIIIRSKSWNSRPNGRVWVPSSEELLNAIPSSQGHLGKGNKYWPGQQQPDPEKRINQWIETVYFEITRSKLNKKHKNGKEWKWMGSLILFNATLTKFFTIDDVDTYAVWVTRRKVAVGYCMEVILQETDCRCVLPLIP